MWYIWHIFRIRWNKSKSNLFYFENYIIFFNFNYQIRNDEHLSCHIELRYKISIQKRAKTKNYFAMKDKTYLSCAFNTKLMPCKLEKENWKILISKFLRSMFRILKGKFQVQCCMFLHVCVCYLCNLFRSLTLKTDLGGQKKYLNF